MVVCESELSGPCIQSAFEKRPAVFTARAAVIAQPVYFTTYVFLCISCDWTCNWVGYVQ
jgi:hypothetical protein